MKIKPDKPAYPQIYCGTLPTEGLTRRELFAAMIMQGLVSNPGMERAEGSSFKTIAVEGADALIEELDKEREK